MSHTVTRRRFVGSALAAAAGTALAQQRGFAKPLSFLTQQSPSPTTTVRAVTRTLDVNGKPGKAMGLLQPDGTQGLTTVVNTDFRVLLENQLTVPTAIHWHGLHPPNNQDGVPGVTQPVIRANASTTYNFPVHPAGTHWMHSHQGLQEGYLLAAPLIVHESAEAARAEQEVVVMLSDFSFTSPQEIYARLRAPKKDAMAMGKPAGGAKSGGMKMGAKPDINDVNYDAYLANDRTLGDPEVVRVDKGAPLRLRIINGATGTNFFVDLGSLEGELIATDGLPVVPVKGGRFPIAISQRIDVRMKIPAQDGAYPILALREGAPEQTGIVLATARATVAKLPQRNASSAGVLNLDLESRLTALTPLAPKPIAQTNLLRLGGNMMRYDWMINGKIFDVENPGAMKAQVRVRQGERVALLFVNETPMTHPMHLHGHDFQVIAINGKPMQGARRDSILVPGNTSVTVAFDADNPGLWYVHCHVLWHLAAGMAALVEYES